MTRGARAEDSGKSIAGYAQLRCCQHSGTRSSGPCAREKLDKIPMALIVDSPWIPGYLGISHLDYYLDPELWFQSNLQIIREFPDIIFVPGWWMEYGMAAEPSVLGAKIKFWQDNTPSEYHTLYRLEDIDEFPEYEVDADAFAGLTLHRIRMHRQRILDAGYILPLVTARGPMCTAGFVRGTTNFMIDLVENPEGSHKLIDLCTRVVIDWLKAQQRRRWATPSRASSSSTTSWAS
jgi:hypothetical protein